MVLCQPGLSDLSKLYCWSDPSPRARCASGGEGCSFSYSAALTPRIADARIAAGSDAEAPAVLEVSGQLMGGVASIQLVGAGSSNGGLQADCPLLLAPGISIGGDDGGATSVLRCLLPAELPAGRYKVGMFKREAPASRRKLCPGAAVQCVRDNPRPRSTFPLQVKAVTAKGEQSTSASPDTSASLLRTPAISAADAVAGSVAGGGHLRLVAAPGGAPFNTTHPNQNLVLVGGQRCTVLPGAVLQARSLACAVPPLLGAVRLEYWHAPVGVDSLPDLRDWQQPGEADRHRRVGDPASD